MVIKNILHKFLPTVLALTFWGLTIWGILSLFGKPDHKRERPPPKPKSREESMYMRNLSQEALILISKKYEIPQDRLSKLFFEYCSMTGRGCDSFRGKVNRRDAKKPVANAIDEIANKYGMASKEVAEVIIDERKLRQVNSECVDPNNLEYHEDNLEPEQAMESR